MTYRYSIIRHQKCFPPVHIFQKQPSSKPRKTITLFSIFFLSLNFLSYRYRIIPILFRPGNPRIELRLVFIPAPTGTVWFSRLYMLCDISMLMRRGIFWRFLFPCAAIRQVVPMPRAHSEFFYLFFGGENISATVK